ncbi:MAG TPA: adventurous gliding motility protein CglE [Anaeromyxobacteraceae bacterium]|nr:adventurous gliding motility protein CglE [Anaeromyxobacteraceae bacterium]
MLPSKASTAPTRMLLALLAVAALLPVAARGQDAAPPMPEDPRAPRYREVERGLFTGFEVGYLSLFKTPTADRVKFPFAGADGGRAGGLLVGAILGYDLSSRLAVSLYALGGNARASISYGAFSVLSAGGDVRLALYGSSDSYGVERLHFYVHGRGGLLITEPEGLLGKNDVYVAGGPGVEYFTHLRHFSVGLAADVAYLTKAKAAGLTVTPTVRYTF